MNSDVCLVLFCLSPFILAAVFMPKKRTKKRKKKRQWGRKTIYIYGLKDGRNIFYVGQSVDPNRRLNQHINHNGKGWTKKDKYIWRMKRKGKTPGMVILAKSNSPSGADKLERRYIKKYGKTNMKHR